MPPRPGAPPGSKGHASGIKRGSCPASGSHGSCQRPLKLPWPPPRTPPAWLPPATECPPTAFEGPCPEKCTSFPCWISPFVFSCRCWAEAARQAGQTVDAGLCRELHRRSDCQTNHRRPRSLPGVQGRHRLVHQRGQSKCLACAGGAVEAVRGCVRPGGAGDGPRRPDSPGLWPGRLLHRSGRAGQGRPGQRCGHRLCGHRHAGGRIRACPASGDPSHAGASAYPDRPPCVWFSPAVSVRPVLRGRIKKLRSLSDRERNCSVMRLH